MIDTVLFDLDGTVIDSNQLILDNFKYVFEVALPHVKLKEEDYLMFIGPTLKQSISKYTTSEEELNRIIEMYRKRNVELHDLYVKPYDGAKILFQRLKEKGIKIGIVSSKMHYLIKRGLAISELREYVDYIVGSDDVENHKPHPEPILKAIEFFQTQNAIYVGDHPNDILAAKNAKIPSIGVMYSWVKDELKKSNPTYLVYSLLEIEEVISCMM